MADSLFNKGDYAAAAAEYAALAGDKTLAADEILYRQAECERARGRSVEAKPIYERLVKEFPTSRHVPRSRLMLALSSEGEARLNALRLLDDDAVELSIRSAALYHLGEALGDAAVFEKCFKLDPKGIYADYAKLHCASVLSKSESVESRRKGLSLLLDLAFDPKSKLAEEALYLAAGRSFSDRNYGEAGTLFHRYLKKYPKGVHSAEASDACAWSDYLVGRHSVALQLCEGRSTEDAVFVKAAVINASGDAKTAEGLFERYLSDFPKGRYRKDAELALARFAYDRADKAGDVVKRKEAARRAMTVSGAAGDTLRFGWAAEQNGDVDEAKEVYRSVAEKFPGSPEAAEAMYLAAVVDMREGRWSAAELELREAIAGKLDERRRNEAGYWQGVVACRLGHDEEGRRLLLKALEQGLSLDQTREARLVIADVDFNAGRKDEALKAYEALVIDGAAERMSASKTYAVGKLLSPEGRKRCALALAKCEAAEWRQAGFALLGEAEEALGNIAAAKVAYQRCVDEKVETESLPASVLRLGEFKLCDQSYAEAEADLKRAVELNAKDSAARARAYLALAKCALGRQDVESAKGYLVVVTTLFEKSPSAAEAARLLKEAEEGK